MEYLLSASSCSGPWTYKLKTHLLCCSGVLTNGCRVNEEVQNETLHLHCSSCALAFSLHCLCFPNYWPQYGKRNAELDWGHFNPTLDRTKAFLQNRTRRLVSSFYWDTPSQNFSRIPHYVTSENNDSLMEFFLTSTTSSPSSLFSACASSLRLMPQIQINMVMTFN